MKRMFLAGMAALALLPMTSRAADPAPDAEAAYRTMLAAAKANPEGADWQALRFAYADRPSFSMLATDDGRRAIHAAYAAHDWQGVLTAAAKVLDIDYVDGEAHLASSIAYGELGKADDAAREQKIAVAIFKSMMSNGDGQSPEHAFVVISVAEEYELMSARKRHVTSQSLSRQGGHAYDVLTTAGANGDAATFYFQIDRVMAAESRMFTPH